MSPLIIGIHEHRNGPELDNRQRRRECRDRRRQYPVARPAAQRTERNLDRVQPAGDPHRMRKSPVRGQFRLKRANLLAQNVPATGPDPFESGQRIFAKVRPLAREIVRWYQQLQWELAGDYLPGSTVRITISRWHSKPHRQNAGPDPRRHKQVAALHYVFTGHIAEP